jgi:hypothetical protein
MIAVVPCAAQPDVGCLGDGGEAPRICSTAATGRPTVPDILSQIETSSPTPVGRYLCTNH